MSTATRPSERPTRASPPVRVWRAWRALASEQRIAAVAALALWLTMFLPWYSESPAGAVKKGESAVSSTLTAWGAFSWVELGVLAVVIGVLALLFARGERRGFHLPGGDGFAIVVAGVFAAVLVVYGMFDRGSTRTGTLAITTGDDWGIFFALLAALWLAWSGRAMRRAHRAEPQAAIEEPAAVRPRMSAAAAAAPATPRDPSIPHRGVARADAEQLTFELPEDRQRSDL